jgi:GT2 family glycosyltransferase
VDGAFCLTVWGAGLYNEWMNERPLISVIIVSLNGEERMPACLRAVYQSDWPNLEVIVVDNGSADRTSEVTKREAPQAMVIRAERNLGFAGGNNLGLERAQGELLVLLNDDCEPYPGWLKALAQAADELPDWGVLGCKLLYPGDEKIIQHAGGLVEANALSKHVGYGERDEGQHNGRTRCAYVTGAAFAIRRETLERVGLLDAGFFPIYYEELDFCYRAARAGYGSYYVPDAEVIHHESMTTKRLSFGFLCKYHRNRLRFIIRNFDRGQLRRAMRRECSWLIRHRPWGDFAPLLLAYGRALLGIVPLWRARRRLLRGGDQ